MFPKIFTYDGQFEHTGEARMQIVDRRDLRLHRNEKYASEDIWGGLSEVKPEPGKTTLLVLAMSSSEYYGPNRNGDAFSEGPIEVNGQMLVRPGQELPCHHKSFEDGHVFKHHINKDPKKALGEILQSAYNWMMHRVELLVQLENAKCQDIVGRVNGGEFPGVSMGCKIDYDVCSICGNKAPTRAQYCNHVNGNDPRYGMNALTEDGRRCCVYNPDPRFFDLSAVFKPADRIGFTMKKVAYERPYEIQLSADVGAKVADLSEKSALLGKLSEIDKVIKGVAGEPGEIDKIEPGTERFAREIAPKLASPMVDPQVLASLKHASLPEIMSSFAKLGMCPSAKEIFVVICAKDGLNPSQEMIEKVGNTQGAVADLLSVVPEVFDSLAAIGLMKTGEALVRPEIVEAILPWREKRALYKDLLARRYIPESYGVALGEMTGRFDPDKAYYEPTQTLLHYRDPETGRVYQTTRGAAEQTDLSNVGKEMAEAAGLAGVLGVMYKTMTASPKTQWLAPAALAGTGALGYKTIQGQKMPMVETFEGELVPANTEFVEKRGAWRWPRMVTPLAGGALLTLLMAQDYTANPYESPISRLAWEHPLATGLVGTAATSGLLETGKNVLKTLTKSGSVIPADSIEINLDSVINVVAGITFPSQIARGISGL
jgi:hypothetical protein